MDSCHRRNYLQQYFFQTEIIQAIIAAMVLGPNLDWKNCLRVISAVRGNPLFSFKDAVTSSFGHGDAVFDLSVETHLLHLRMSVTGRSYTQNVLKVQYIIIQAILSRKLMKKIYSYR